MPRVSFATVKRLVAARLDTALGAALALTGEAEHADVGGDPAGGESAPADATARLAGITLDPHPRRPSDAETADVVVVVRVDAPEALVGTEGDDAVEILADTLAAALAYSAAAVSGSTRVEFGSCGYADVEPGSSAEGRAALLTLRATATAE